MFLCEKCLTENFKTTMWDLLIAPRSRGGCEYCGQGAVCYDIPSRGLRPKDKPNSDKNVQECDTTGDDSSNEAK